ncbi:MAG: hypothetical protein PW734_06825 [Verrucomicrobium sp.]|nr:hypothetical protein [Verrucomicrobium sp.]
MTTKPNPGKGYRLLKTEPGIPPYFVSGKPKPKTRKVTLWMNVYERPVLCGYAYATKWQADEAKGPDRLGNRAHKVVIEIPVEKGGKK